MTDPSRLNDEDREELVAFLDGELSEDDAHKVELFRSAWVHVLTSPKEGWGIANLEAAACVTPTVASDSPGLRDSVLDGRTGYLVPPADVGPLTEAIAGLLRAPELARQMGEAGRERALEYFLEERCTDRTEILYRSALNGDAP